MATFLSKLFDAQNSLNISNLERLRESFLENDGLNREVATEYFSNNWHDILEQLPKK